MKLFLIILLLSFSVEAQVKQKTAPRIEKRSQMSQVVRKIQEQSQALDVFRKVELGIRTNLVDEYENELGIMVSIAIGSDERGNYSMNQAASILLNYFSGRRPVSFEFSSIHENDSTPYATGRFVYSLKGNQESAQIYISLSWQETRWVISQFNIY